MLVTLKFNAVFSS